MAPEDQPVWGEARVVALLVEGRHLQAVEVVLAWLGPEVREFLVATLRDQAKADAAFARFQRDVHAGLVRWNRTGSLRLWALDLARAAANRTATRWTT